MPKSKITNSGDLPQAPGTDSSAQRAPVRINIGGTPLWYKILMFALLGLGLAWLVLSYLLGDTVPLFVELGPWNYAIGFAGMILGLLMTMGWR